MTTNLKEKYKDLSLNQLKKFSSKDYSNFSLFLLAQKEAVGGFIEKYSLREETATRLKQIRERIKNDPAWKDSIIELIEEYIPMSYNYYKKLAIGSQEYLINKSDDGNFSKRFEELFYSDSKNAKQKVKE